MWKSLRDCLSFRQYFYSVGQICAFISLWEQNEVEEEVEDIVGAHRDMSSEQLRDNILFRQPGF